MTNALPVLKYLKEVVGSHKFGAISDDTRRNNFMCELERSIVLKGTNGLRASVPTGSTLVVYRDPARVYDSKMTVACFHHTGGTEQTVIMGGGRMRTTQLGRKTLIDRTRRLPRLYLPDFD